MCVFVHGHTGVALNGNPHFHNSFPPLFFLGYRADDRLHFYGLHKQAHNDFIILVSGNSNCDINWWFYC